MRRVLDVVAIVVVLVVGYYDVFIPLLGSPPNTAAAALAADKQEDAQRRSDMNLLQQALAGYFKDHSAYPLTQLGTSCGADYDNLGALAPVLVPRYLARIPRDPKPPSCPYNYMYVSDGQNYVIKVRLAGVDPYQYNDHWCIGAAAGSLPPQSAYLPCP